MTGLRWYDRQGISNAARQLMLRFEGGAAGWLDYAVEASQYKFRDSSGDYWFLDVSVDQWYKFGSGAWRLSTASPDTVEGLESLYKIVGMPEAALKDLPDPFAQRVDQTPVQVLELFQREARQRYREGLSSSTSIEELLARLLLLDQEGIFWTIGFHSGKWYRFSGGMWNQASTLPDPALLMRTNFELDDLPGDAAVQVYRFLLRGAGSLPEPVTEPWKPPESFPDLNEPGAACSLCGAHNLPSSLFCSRCGARLGCANCGAQNPPGSRFCTRCGASLGCPNCGAQNPPGDHFCNKCGRPLPVNG